MSIREKLAMWRTRHGAESATQPHPSLREFVYLDEVSVYSLLASRKGAIATDFTDTESASLNSQFAGSLGGGFGLAKVEARASVEGGQAYGSQVMRKAIVQTSFKEFRELESERLALNVPTGDPPLVTSVTELGERLDSLLAEGWVIDPSRLQRGALAEVEVVLTVDPIFSATAAISTMRDLMEESPELFGVRDSAQLAEVRAVGGVLDKLLAGLVPVRCQLVSFEAVEVRGSDYLVHPGLIEAQTAGAIETQPVFLVGVAQRELFWKDIRRVLFSESRFSLFCRISQGELTRDWRPVKGVEVLNAIHPVFNQYMRDIGAQFLAGMQSAFEGLNEPAAMPGDQGRALLETFSQALAAYHGKVLSAEQLSRLHVSVLKDDASWPDSVDSRRPVLNEARVFVERELWVRTPHEVAARLRLAAVGKHPGLKAEMAGTAADFRSGPDRERFLDVEIVAIYW